MPFLPAGCIDCFGNYVYAILRTMVANCVPAEERGQVYAVWTSADNLIPLTTAQLYKEVWEATQNTATGAFYMVSAYCSGAAYTIAIYLALQLKGRPLAEVTGIMQLERERRANAETEKEEEEANDEPFKGGRHIAMPPEAYKDQPDNEKKSVSSQL